MCLSKTHYQRILGLLFGSSLFICIAMPSKSEVVPDTTLPNPSTVSVSEDRIIVESGTRPQNGANLFHSFTDFNIGSRESVYFDSPNGVERIFSRVTGNSKSTIRGTLGTRGIESTDLFFLNPNGVIFGPNAELNVSGSFIVSTADAIGFHEGGLFSATVPEHSVLLSVRPNAFFFNPLPTFASDRGHIIHRAVIDSEEKTRGRRGLSVPDGETFGLLGGPISINRGVIRVVNGRIELGSVRDASTVSLIFRNNQYHFSYNPNLVVGFQDIRFNNANIQSDGQGRGSIQVVGDDITLLNRTLVESYVEQGVPQNSAGQIRIVADSTLMLEQDNSSLEKGGSNISSRLDNGTSSQSYGVDVEIRANQITLYSRTEIASYIVGGNGVGGQVTIQGQDILVSDVFRLNDESSILSANQDSAGAAGNVLIKANTLHIMGSGRVATTLSGNADGRGGHLRVEVEDSIDIEGPQALLVSNVTRDTTSGQAGDLTIETNWLSIKELGLISTSLNDVARDDTSSDNATSSTTEAGTLRIEANNIQINGIGVNEEQWDELTDERSRRLSILTGILSETNPGNRGNAGLIDIQVNGTLEIRDGGGIAATAQSSSEIIQGGEGGSIQINAERLRMDGGNLLTGTSATNGGNIDLSIAELLFLQNGSEISTSAGQIGAGGDGGRIRIQMPNGVLAALPNTNSDIEANAFSGSGGELRISARGIIGLSPRSRNELEPFDFDPSNLQSNDMVAFSQINPNASDDIEINTNDDFSRTEELPSGLTDASSQIEQTVCRATQGSEFLVTGQGGVLPSPREQFRSEDVWEDWRLMNIAEAPLELLPLSSTAEQAEVSAGSEEDVDVAITPTLQPLNAQTLSLPNAPTPRSDRPTNPSMGYAVANPSYEQTPQLIEAQSWQTTPNGDIILVANAPSANNSASLPSLTPPSTTCQTHSPATGESAS